MSSSVQVHEMKKCDFCMIEQMSNSAKYDGNTYGGAWAYMCEAHFQEYGVGLGTGKGQILELIND